MFFVHKNKLLFTHLHNLISTYWSTLDVQKLMSFAQNYPNIPLTYIKRIKNSLIYGTIYRVWSPSTFPILNQSILYRKVKKVYFIV